MSGFNFDEWRAARTKGGPRTVTFCAQEWTIPGEMPWVVSDFIAMSTRRHLAPAVRGLMGEPSAFADDGEAQASVQFDRFTALRLSEDEVSVLLMSAAPSWYAEGGGEDPGNSGGSTEPSPATSEPSVPTSDASTAST